jgi:hypothetical protein
MRSTFQDLSRDERAGWPLVATGVQEHPSMPGSMCVENARFELMVERYV